MDTSDVRDENEKLALITKSPSSLGRPKYTLVIHGGAGTMSKADSTPEEYAAYRNALAEALKAGYAVLRDGGEAMDAAVAAVTSMEGDSCRDISGFSLS
jgi:L-asparaginase / beta-aspartyl-peptidase